MCTKTFRKWIFKKQGKDTALIFRDEQKPNRKLKPHQKPQKPHETAPNKTAPNKNRTETKPHRYFGFDFGF